MFKNAPRSRRPFSKSASSSKGPRGAFEHNQWLCDCNPRLPAEHFQVKKEGNNRGRWFYTCQKGEGDRCGFFLWQEDAEPRMQGAVLSNTHKEHIAKSSEEAKGTKRKRTLPWENEKQDSVTTEDDNFGLSDREEAALSQATTTADQPSPETPRKKLKTEDFHTPSNKGANSATGMVTPGTTPTPARTKDALQEESLSDKAFKLLSVFDVNLEHNAANALRGLLDSESRKWQGVAKGRDAARAAVQSRDQRIVELSDAVSRAEGENEANKALIAHLKGKT